MQSETGKESDFNETIYQKHIWEPLIITDDYVRVINFRQQHISD